MRPHPRHKMVSGGRDTDVVTGRFRSQQIDSPVIQVHPVEMRKIGVPALLPTHTGQQQRPLLFIDPDQVDHIPASPGDLALALTGRQIMQIEVSPVICTCEPYELAALMEDSPVGSAARGEIGFKTGCECLRKHLPDLPRLWISKIALDRTVITGCGVKR